MSQAKIIELLEKEDRWITAKEIAKKLKLSKSPVKKALESLRKYRELKYMIKYTPYKIYFYKKA